MSMSPRDLPLSLPFDPLRSIKPPASLQPPKIGLEFEFFAFDASNFIPIGCLGSHWTPLSILRAIEAQGPVGTVLRWDPDDTGVAIGVGVPGGWNFSLEPGGQLEFASSPHTSLEGLLLEVAWALELLEKATLGEVVFLSHGTHPTALNTLPLLVPKGRYLAMNRYLSSAPAGRGIHMMRHTATVQPNLDTIGGLEGWRRSVESVAILSPILGEMWENSLWFQGFKSHFNSERLEIWNHTDPSRTGYGFAHSPFWPHPDNMEGAYAQWAWNAFVILVPQLPLDQQPLFGELTFAHWWESGYKGVRPTEESWECHLSTLFPHLRLRQFLEIRDIDAQDFSCLAYPLAIWVALLQTEGGVSQGIPRDLPRHVSPILDWAHALAVNAYGKGNPVTKLVQMARQKKAEDPARVHSATAMDFVQSYATSRPSWAFRRGHGLT